MALKNWNKKLGWEIRQDGQVKTLQESKILRKEKKNTIGWHEKTKARQQTNLMIQLEEMNQKILAKEEGLKRYRDKVK